MVQATQLNKEKKIGLLWGAELNLLHGLMSCMGDFNRGALWRQPSITFINLSKTGRIIEAIKDIEGIDFWKHIYFVPQALFPALKALWFFDTNFPGMDKIYYLIHSARCVIAKLVALLRNENLFAPTAH